MLKILTGDALEELMFLPSGSVQCCVTSPPYWGLRDYGTAKWVGGDSECDHKAPSRFGYALNSGLGPTGVQDQASNIGSGSVQQYRDICRKCGAVRTDHQLGLEKTPEEYVSKLVAVFAEVRRVLRDNGTLWLNLGDSYSAQAGQRKVTDKAGLKQQSDVASVNAPSRCAPGYKAKDLVGIPWMVAFALRADGWYLRSDIIWSKPNPMPESVTDRPTKAHEYLFLLSKSQRYHYDAEAIQEDAISRQGAGATGRGKNAYALASGFNGNPQQDHSGWTGGDGKHRNKRSVWTIPTKPYKGAHFATFPPNLILPCILAGCPTGGMVLDPFGGSGTTAMVALENGRRATLIELNPEYIPLIHARCSKPKFNLDDF